MRVFSTARYLAIPLIMTVSACGSLTGQEDKAPQADATNVGQSDPIDTSAGQSAKTESGQPGSDDNEPPPCSA